MNLAARLRDASPNDSELVFGIFRDAMRPYVELVRGGWDEATELALHKERYGRQRCRIVVAGDTDAGYVSTAVYPEASAAYPAGLYLHHLMIRPAFQSKGIGSLCLKWLDEEARQLGMALNLRVLRVNPRALSFYLASGGAVVGESESHMFVRMVEEARREREWLPS